MPRHPAWLLPCPGFAVSRPGWKVVETQEMGAKLSDAKCRKAWLWPSGCFFSAPLLATQYRPQHSTFKELHHVLHVCCENLKD